MEQLTLFGNNDDLKNKFIYALLLSAVGDSLGWPLEFARKSPKKPLETFIKWNKLVGGKWWGYVDEIKPGEYSDDTQLTLSVARSIDSSGNFNPEYFAYLELPLWLNYERGGGRSIKAAARNILKKKSDWLTNFYETKVVDYKNAGANGAAMRNLPITLINANNERKFIIDSFKNSIITHGHPRAIIGSIILGASQIYLLRNKEINFRNFKDYLFDIMHGSLNIAREDKYIKKWLSLEKNNFSFDKLYEDVIQETKFYIKNMENYLTQDEKQYYSFTKALDSKHKGSGISTTVVSIFLVLKNLDNPEKALFRAANMVGSDTDTIASFTGSLLGAFYGSSLPSQKLKDLICLLQDKDYFVDIGQFLWDIKFTKLNYKDKKNPSKTDAFLKILAWEIGLHEMFWEALKEGDRVIHPTLGKGIIENKVIKSLKREDYVAKIIKIKFEIGQTCYFHSRVSKEGLVTESISKDVERVLL